MTEETKKKRGGVRPGAGRPRKPEPPPKVTAPPRYIAGTTINAVEVGELARDGASVEIITAYLRIPSTLMQDAAFLAEFEAEVKFGVAAQEVDLLRERKAHAAQGKVGATLYALRNLPDRSNTGASSDYRNAICEVDAVLSRLRER